MVLVVILYSYSLPKTAAPVSVFVSSFDVTLCHVFIGIAFMAIVSVSDTLGRKTKLALLANDAPPYIIYLV